MADPGTLTPSLRRLIPLSLLIIAAVVFMLSGGRHYLTFAQLADHRALLCGFVERAGFLAVIGFTLAYAVLTALSVPGAMLMTLAAGFLFGPWFGGIYALLGATCGAGAVFLAARTGLAGLVDRAGPRVQRLKARFRADAFSYLLCLRLVPLFPFWLVNLAAGAANMPLSVYLTATFFGMIPGTFVYAGIGNSVGSLIATGQRPDHYAIFRPNILLPLIGLALLALLPVVFRHWTARQRTAP
jgi:uncharacterized membrane protein YdjX (TVP38/TMEM64 family)